MILLLHAISGLFNVIDPLLLMLAYQKTKARFHGSFWEADAGGGSFFSWRCEKGCDGYLASGKW